MTRPLKCPRYGTDGRELAVGHPEYIDPDEANPPPFECEHCGYRGTMRLTWSPAVGLLWHWIEPTHRAPICRLQCLHPGASYRGDFHVGWRCWHCRAIAHAASHATD